MFSRNMSRKAEGSVQRGMSKTKRKESVERERGRLVQKVSSDDQCLFQLRALCTCCSLCLTFSSTLFE